MGQYLLYSLLVLSTTAIPPLEVSADQSGRLVGVHEIPAFVRERIELTPGTFDERDPAVDPRPKDRTAEDVGAG
jgi:hypothetical protein